MSVYLQTGGTGPYSLLYSIDLSGYARPNNLVMGFTGSTGGSTDVHQVNDVALTSVVSNLWTNGAGTSTWGAQGTTTNDTNWNNTPASNPAVGGDILFDNSQVSIAQAIAVTGNQVVRNLQIDASFSYTLNGGSIEFNGSSAAGPPAFSSPRPTDRRARRSIRTCRSTTPSRSRTTRPARSRSGARWPSGQTPLR